MENFQFKNKFKNFSYYLVILVGIGLANIALADETITIIGEPIPRERSLLPGFGGGGGGGGDSGGGGGGFSSEERKAQCLAKADSAVTNCKDAVVEGGAWLGGTFCLAAGVVGSFFTTPLGGAAIGVACGGAGAVGGNEAMKKCEIAGLRQKNEC